MPCSNEFCCQSELSTGPSDPRPPLKNDNPFKSVVMWLTCQAAKQASRSDAARLSRCS